MGWFTTLYPLRLDPGRVSLTEAEADGAVVASALRQVKEQIRACPDNGIGYGLLRYLNPETRDILRNLPTPQIGFNYLGRFSGGRGGEGVSAEELAVLQKRCDRDLPLAHVVELDAVASEQPEGTVLVANWSWADGLLARSQVEPLAAAWFTALRGMVRHAAEGSSSGLTPSDVPLVTLDQDDIEYFEKLYETGN